MARIHPSLSLSSTSTLYLIITTPHSPFLVPFLPLIGNLFRLPLYPLLSAWLLSAGPSPALPSATAPNASPPSLFLAARPPPHPQAEAPSHPFHSRLLAVMHPSPPFPTTHSRLSLPAAPSTRQVVCVYRRLISADTCSILPLTSLCPHTYGATHTHTHTHRRGWGESMKQNAPVNNLVSTAGNQNGACQADGSIETANRQVTQYLESNPVPGNDSVTNDSFLSH